MGLILYSFWTLTTAAWVWLALAPAPESAPEWLMRTREVCFGTLETGLPDVHGWISLAAPIPMLIALLVLMGSELRDQLRSLSRSFLGKFLAAALLLAPPGTLSYVAFRVAEAPRLQAAPEMGPLPVDYPLEDQPCPEFRLQDQKGRWRGKGDLAGRVSLLTFAYAHCQTVCPGLIENFRRVARDTGARAVVVTLDPRRDTCGSLTGLAHYWELPEGSWLLGGEVDEVESALKAFGVTFDRDQKTGEIVHPALVYVLDREGHIRYRFASPSQEWLRTACQNLESKE